MSKKILSFIDREEKEDWFDLSHPYLDDDIDMIHDPEGGMNAKPRTAIPSPFAQIDLVQEAFRQLGAPKRSNSDRSIEMQSLRLVRNSLDVAELFFNFNKFENELEILSWNATEHLRAMENSLAPGQQMLAQTLRMYLTQDRDAYNFPDINHGEKFELFFLKNRRDSRIVGLTSPATLFMAVPDDDVRYDIEIEQGSMLFDWSAARCKDLHERDKDFLTYILAIINANPQVKEKCNEFCSYVKREFELLDAETRMELTARIGDVTSNNPDDALKASNFLAENYEPLRFNNVPVATFQGSVAVYTKKLQVSIDSASDSDFLIVPTKEVVGQRPMVLDNCFNPPAGVTFNYVNTPWAERQHHCPA